MAAASFTLLAPPCSVLPVPLAVEAHHALTAALPHRPTNAGAAVFLR